MRHDPGFSLTGDRYPLHNRVGRLGAWIADCSLPVRAPGIPAARRARRRCWLTLRNRSVAEPRLASESLVKLMGFAVLMLRAARWRRCTGVRAHCPRAPVA